VLSIDARIFRCWARFIHRRFDRLIEDVMIAATVMVHNLTVVTRNVRDFEHFEVYTLNPFDTAAGYLRPSRTQLHSTRTPHCFMGRHVLWAR
jgi:hypothetical protein